VGVKRKQHSAAFKARIAMAALSGEKTPGRTVVGVRRPSDDDQHLEAGADEASERVVCAWLAALQLASADVVERVDVAVWVAVVIGPIG
jgi:hypothetical protein